jgi:hypothetical protein
MARYYALNAEDLAFIRQHRGADNRLGVALQLCTLRFPGRLLMQMTLISERVVVYVAEQLGLPATAFAKYGKRRNTLYHHLQNICQQYGYQACARDNVMPLMRYLLPFALENEEALPLVDGAMAWIRQHKRIAPTILITEKLVWHVQRIARRRVYRRIQATLSAAQETSLQDLLVVAADKGGQTPLSWLRLPSSKPSPEGMHHLLERIVFLNQLQLPGRPTQCSPHPFREAFRAMVAVTRMTLLLRLTNKSFLQKRYKCPFHGAHIPATKGSYIKRVHGTEIQVIYEGFPLL